MNSILRGVYTGLMAGLILAVLYFIDYNAGNDLHTVARWLGLDNAASGKITGFVLLILLGGLFGLVFSLIQRGRTITFSHAVITGLVLGIVWWILFPLIGGSFLGHISLSLGSVLYAFILCLVYGLLLGTLYFRSTMRKSLFARGEVAMLTEHSFNMRTILKGDEERLLYWKNIAGSDHSHAEGVEAVDE